MYETIQINGKKIGLKLNPEKNHLIRFHNNNVDVTSQINIEGRMLVSGYSLKKFGFNFSPFPTVSLHISEIIRKFNENMWSIAFVQPSWKELFKCLLLVSGLSLGLGLATTSHITNVPFVPLYHHTTPAVLQAGQKNAFAGSCNTYLPTLVGLLPT